MDPDQLQQLIAAMQQGQQSLIAAASKGGTHKISKYSSGKAEDWELWRRGFEAALKTNQWPLDRQKREAMQAMTGRAGQQVHRYDLKEGDDTFTIKDLLDLYQTRFVQASASTLAQAQFEKLSQMNMETILDFHGRVATCFHRAYPNEDAQASPLILKQFVMNLNCAEVRLQTMRSRPKTFDEALEKAQLEAANQSLITNYTRKRDSSNFVGSAGHSSYDRNGCHNCGEVGHYIANCPKPPGKKRYTRQGHKASPNFDPQTSYVAKKSYGTSSQRSGYKHRSGAKQTNTGGKRKPLVRKDNPKVSAVEEEEDDSETDGSQVQAMSERQETYGEDSDGSGEDQDEQGN